MLALLLSLVTAAHAPIIDGSDTIAYETCVQRMLDGNGGESVDVAREACEDYPTVSIVRPLAPMPDRVALAIAPKSVALPVRLSTCYENAYGECFSE